MAYYEYQCNKCSHTFTLHQTFAEHDRQKSIKCPECGSKDVQRSYAAVHVQTARKS